MKRSAVQQIFKSLLDSIRTLVLADEEDIIEDIMETNIISAATMDDKEDVAQDLSRYDFLAMPVVDKESRLVGIVTIDDAIDVMEEEATEDFELMAAITPTDKPYLRAGVAEKPREGKHYNLIN